MDYKYSVALDCIYREKKEEVKAKLWLDKLLHEKDLIFFSLKDSVLIVTLFFLNLDTFSKYPSNGEPQLSSKICPNSCHGSRLLTCVLENFKG